MTGWSLQKPKTPDMTVHSIRMTVLHRSTPRCARHLDACPHKIGSRHSTPEAAGHRTASTCSLAERLPCFRWTSSAPTRSIRAARGRRLDQHHLHIHQHASGVRVGAWHQHWTRLHEMGGTTRASTTIRSHCYTCVLGDVSVLDEPHEEPDGEEQCSLTSGGRVNQAVSPEL